MCSVSHPVVETFAARKERGSRAGAASASASSSAAAAAALPPPERIKMQVFQCCLGEMVLSIFISQAFIPASKQWVDRNVGFVFFGGVRFEEAALAEFCKSRWWQREGKKTNNIGIERRGTQ